MSFKNRQNFKQNNDENFDPAEMSFSLSSTSSSTTRSSFNPNDDNNEKSRGALKKLKKTRKKFGKKIDENKNDGSDSDEKMNFWKRKNKLNDDSNQDISRVAKLSYDDYLIKQIESSNKVLSSSKYLNQMRNSAYLAKTPESVTNNAKDLVLIKYKNIENEENRGSLNSIKSNALQRRREIHSLIIFIFFLFVTIITLSQILVMHSQTNNSNFYQIKMMQEELKLMDASIDKMLKEKHVTPMNTWIALKNYNENLKRFGIFLSEHESFSNYSSFLMNQYDSINFHSYLTRQYSTNIDLKQDLTNELKKCKLVTRDVINILNQTNNSYHMINDYNLIYVNLIYFLEELQNTSINSKLNNNMILNLNESSSNSSNIQNLFKNHLKIYNTTFISNSKKQGINDILKNDLKIKYEKCMQAILYGFFYYLNTKYTNIFERYFEIQKYFLNKTLINELYSITANSTHQIASKSASIKNEKIPNDGKNSSVLKNYENVTFSNEIFKHQIFCDPVPPVLCNFLLL
jgi:hypothetical protein